MDRFSKLIEKKGLAVLDGAMATQLEARGCDINDELWSAKMLAGSSRAHRSRAS